MKSIKDRTELYERIYYHERDRREKITQKAQALFIVYAAIFTTTSYMMKNYDTSSPIDIKGIMLALLIISTAPFIASIWKLVSSYYSNEYKALDSPLDLENVRKIYRDSIIKEMSSSIEVYKIAKTYLDDKITSIEEEAIKTLKLSQKDAKEFNDELKIILELSEESSSELLESYIQDQLIEATTDTIIVNDRRAKDIHHSISYLLLCAASYSLLIVLFSTFNLDASSPRKPLSIEHKKPIQLNEERYEIQQR